MQWAYRSVSHLDFYALALAAIALIYVPGGSRMVRTPSGALLRCDWLSLRLMPSLGRWM